MHLLAVPQIYRTLRHSAVGVGAAYSSTYVIHTAFKHRLISIGQGRGQRALDAEGGRRRATADRRIRMLLITACYGMQGTIICPLPGPYHFLLLPVLADGRGRKDYSRTGRGGGISTEIGSGEISVCVEGACHKHKAGRRVVDVKMSMG
jgi:hypothetical protein